MLKKFALLTVVLTVCFVFSGCSKQSANTDNADSSLTQSDQVNVPPVPPDPIQE